MAWSQSSRKLAQALHACCSIPSGKSQHGRHGLSHTKLHKLTQHTRGETHTHHVSAAPWHTVHSHTTAVHCREHTPAAHSLSMKHPAAAASQCVQQSAPPLASTLRTSLTLSVRCPYVYAPQSPARVPGRCCALATVSSRKRVMYRLRQQRRKQAGHPQRRASLPGLLCVHTTANLLSLRTRLNNCSSHTMSGAVDMACFR